MIKLNLLPPQDKKELELADLNRLTVCLVVYLAIFLIIFISLLLTTFFSLSILLKAQDELIEIRKQDTRIQRLITIEEKIKQANQQLSQVYQKQKGLITWTPVFEEIAKITPQGIYLTNFSFQATNNQINLNGWANKREELLSFQKSLEESSHFIEIEAPLSNLLKQTDINFSFTLKPAR
jgi:type IV pilus assembly protein PilN